MCVWFALVSLTFACMRRISLGFNLLRVFCGWQRCRNVKFISFKFYAHKFLSETKIKQRKIWLTQLAPVNRIIIFTFLRCSGNRRDGCVRGNKQFIHLCMHTSCMRRNTRLMRSRCWTRQAQTHKLVNENERNMNRNTEQRRRRKKKTTTYIKLLLCRNNVDICCVSPLSIRSRSRSNVLQERRVRVLALLMNESDALSVWLRWTHFSVGVHVWVSVSYRICYYFFSSFFWERLSAYAFEGYVPKKWCWSNSCAEDDSKRKRKKGAWTLSRCILPLRTGTAQAKYSTYSVLWGEATHLMAFSHYYYYFAFVPAMFDLVFILFLYLFRELRSHIDDALYFRI